LLLDLLAKKSNEMHYISHDLRHTDDIIYDLAVNQNLAVLMVDKNLKRRLFKSGIDVIEVVQNNYLKLIEGL
jgi:rRNA-processing protein FCF1